MARRSYRKSSRSAYRSTRSRSRGRSSGRTSRAARSGRSGGVLKIVVETVGGMQGQPQQIARPGIPGTVGLAQLAPKSRSMF